LDALRHLLENRGRYMFFDNILNAEECKSLKNVKLEKIEVVKKHNTIKIYADSDCIIDFCDVDHAKQRIKKHFNNSVNVDIVFKYNFDELYLKMDELIIDKIKSNLLYCIQKSSFVLEKASGSSIDIDFIGGGFILKVKSELILNEVKKSDIEEKLKRILKSYKVPYSLTVEHHEAHEEAALTAQKMFEYELKKSIEIIQSSNPSAEKKPQQQAAGDTFRRRRRREEVNYESIPLSKIADVTNDSGMVKVKGKIINIDRKELKTGTRLLVITITDMTDSISAKYFCPKDFNDGDFDSGKYVQIAGNAEYDEYEKQLIIKIIGLEIVEEPDSRMDKATEKRVELHLHTGMSSMDGINGFKEYSKKAKKWGHRALAITDHGVVQGYPEAMDCAGENFKIIYGIEGYLVDDEV
jgi:DNA polymerase-3 subunit alpha (Gram-positive type)